MFTDNTGTTLTARCDHRTMRPGSTTASVQCPTTLGPFEVERGRAGLITRVVGEREAMADHRWSSIRTPKSEQNRWAGSSHYCPKHWRWSRSDGYVDTRTAEEWYADELARESHAAEGEPAS